MNDAELDQKLRTAQGPALDAEYLADFPRQVLARVRSAPGAARVAGPSWWSWLGWGAAATACMIAAFAASQGYARRHSESDVLASASVVQETLALFPNRVRAIVHDEHGLNLVLSDQADVPSSTPIYVRICDGEHCTSQITFSGQEIQIAGQKLTVLSDGGGGIILEGKQFVWSSTSQIHARSNLRIQAKPL